MKKFAVNYNDLEKNLEEKSPVFKLSDVQDKIYKVAFDVVKFNDYEGLDGLWQVQKMDDGDYIVAKYDDDLSPREKTSSWKVLANDSDTVHVFYKGDPVTKISLASVGIPAEESASFIRNLPSSLETNKKLASSMLKELNEKDRTELLASYPELQD